MLDKGAGWWLYVGMRYKPREVFKEFHTVDWVRAILLCHRRAGKTVASCAELLKRAYNGPEDGQYLFISPLAEQSISNTIGIFTGLDDEGYIVRFDKTNGVLTLANGAQITLGGARAGEKFRGRYLNGCVVDEISQVPPELISDVLLPCLADRQGWLCFLGTARVDDDYRLFRMYKLYSTDPKWYSKMVSVYDNPEAFPPERIEELRAEHIQYCLAAGMSMTQAKQSFNVEFECDFDFIEQGRPNLSAVFYNELNELFNSNPSRLLDPKDDEATAALASPQKIAIFDISHSTGRDYTVGTFLSITPTTPYVFGIEWENNKPLSYWFDRLRLLGISTVALPFDANTTNKETLLTLTQTFRREGFNVIRIKRLLRPEQEENGRWLLNVGRFSTDCIPALSEIGKFNGWKQKHGLEQDVVASLLYAGQVARRKHIKIELAESIRSRYNNGIYDTGVSYYGNNITGE